MLDLQSCHQAYYEDWLQMLEAVPPHPESPCRQVLVFSLGGCYFGFWAHALRKVMKPRTIYPIPNNSKEWLLGLVKAKRKLQLTLDLNYLLSTQETVQEPPSVYPQEVFLFLEEANDGYIFPVSQVIGLQALVPDFLKPISGTDKGLFLGQFMRDRHLVSLICHTSLFQAIDRLLESSPLYCET